MKRHWIFYLAMSLVFIQCGKKALIRKYYIFETPREISLVDSVATQILPYNVDVRDFQISKAINQTRIALRSNSHELNYYFYHHWAVRPSAGVADMIYQIFAQKKQFQRLVRGYSTHPNYIITGDIRNLERDETGKKIKVHFAATLEFIDAKSHIAIVSHDFDRMEPYQNPKKMNTFAESVSLILHEETDLFIQMISYYFQQNTEAISQ